MPSSLVPQAAHRVGKTRKWKSANPSPVASNTSCFGVCPFGQCAAAEFKRGMVPGCCFILEQISAELPSAVFPSGFASDALTVFKSRGQRHLQVDGFVRRNSPRN